MLHRVAKDLRELGDTQSAEALAPIIDERMADAQQADAEARAARRAAHEANPYKGYADEGDRRRTYLHFRSGWCANAGKKYELHRGEGPGHRLMVDCHPGFQAYRVSDEDFDVFQGRVLFVDWLPDDLHAAMTSITGLDYRPMGMTVDDGWIVKRGKDRREVSCAASPEGVGVDITWYRLGIDSEVVATAWMPTNDEPSTRLQPATAPMGRWPSPATTEPCWS